MMRDEAGEDDVAGGDDVDNEAEPARMLGTQVVHGEEALEDGVRAIDGGHSWGSGGGGRELLLAVGGRRYGMGRALAR